MTCNHFEHRLHELEDYLDGRLNAAQRSEIDLHLSSCDACRMAMEDAPIAGRLLRAAFAPSAEMPVHGEAFVTRVRAQVRGAAQEQPDFWGSLEAVSRRLAWVAAAAVLILGAFVAADVTGIAPATSQTAEVREIFPEPEQQPASGDEVLMSLSMRSGR